MTAPTVRLNNGLEIPVIGIGTWLSPPGECARAIKHAISVGYRHIDCAWLYGNEHEVGLGVKEAIEEGIVRREDLFIVTKLWNNFHERDQVVPKCRESLKNFGLDYVDLYLIHWPVACRTAGKFNIRNPFEGADHYSHDFVETWKGMEECLKLGLTKSIGLSNFNSKQIDRILAAAEIKPVVNQVEVTPNLNQKKLIAFCKQRDILITAYGPLGSRSRSQKRPGEPDLHLDDPRLINIGRKYGKTGAQVVLRYLIQIGTIPIPKSSNLERIKQNFDIFDFELTPEDMEVVDTFDCNGRIVLVEAMSDSPEYPFRGVEF